MEAKDEFDLANILRQENSFLISSKLASETAKIKNIEHLLNRIASFFKIRQGIPITEKMMFSRNLSVMIGAGLSLNRALDVLSKQTDNMAFKKILGSVSEEVQKGKSFSDALSLYVSAFSNLYINMIRSSEAAGNLEDILQLLSKQLKKEYDLKRKIRGAFMYPAVILVAMIAIGILMMIFVVPSLARTFRDLGVPLPLTTRIIIAISEFGVNYWYLFFGFIAGGIYSIILFFRTRMGKNMVDALFLKMPLLSPLTKKINSARFARTMSSLLEGGVPIVKSLEITAETIPNHFYKDSLKKTIEKVQKGESLSKSLEEYPELYPPLVTQMIAVGEETGSISDVLKHLAIFFESEVSQATKNMSTIIEPLLMIVIGIAVGFFAISMMQPMYSIVEAI